MTPTLAAVVVHHRRYPQVLETLRSLVAAGVEAGSIVLVDNSEDETTTRALKASSEGWRIHTMANRGYGAAVNAGVGLITDADVVLVLTHETLVDAASVRAMADAVVGDPTVAAAGPGTLFGDNGRVWSRGGVLSSRLRLPKHIDTARAGHEPLRAVDWLDGACVAYRREALTQNPFREDFFLYIEETELHSRLRKTGWRVLAVNGASAAQSTQGMPSYWGCRNMVLFQRAHGTPLSRVVGPLYFTFRSIGVSIVERRWRDALQAPLGLVAGCREVRAHDG